MSKYRPERLEMIIPTKMVEKFEPLLKENLKPAARLKRLDSDGKTTFVFSPTKGEYFVVSMSFMAICQSIGAVLVTENEP